MMRTDAVPRSPKEFGMSEALIRLLPAQVRTTPR